ncbi:hypothetical protein [Sphingomonas antarctica]|uniref:hypothetical protein n=1 Tax=Sphingomonas antarctica TaxID=2040274 RepID=UPI0039E9E12E
METEDFINPGLFVEAVNIVLSHYHPNAKRIDLNECSGAMRTKKVADAYKKATGVKLPKVEVAYEILNILDSDPERVLIDRQRASVLRDKLGKIEKLFFETTDG